MQKVFEWNREKVKEKIRKWFPGENSESILSLLDEYKGGSEGAVARVQLAVLKLSSGSADKIKDLMDLAKRDSRDVIASAEYPKFFAIGFAEVQKLSDTEKKTLAQDDLRQYMAWLKDEL